MNRYIKLLLKYPKSIIAILTLVSIIAFIPLRELRIGDVRTGWLGKKDEALTTFRNFQSTFHTGEEIVIAYPLPQGITSEEIKWQKEFCDSLKNIPGVFKVTSLSTLNSKINNTTNIDSIMNLYPDVSMLLLSEDHSFTSIIVGVGRKEDYRIPESDTVHSLVQSINNLCKKAKEERNRPFYKSGQIIISDQISKGISFDISLLFPLTIILAIAILYFTFRHWAYTVIPIIATSLALLWTISLKALCNSPLTPLSTTLFVLISVLGIADSLHLFSHLHQALRSGDSIHNAVNKALQHAGKACFYTSLTTSIGFLSLSLSTMPIIRELGIFAAIGIFFAFITTIISLPLTVALVPNIPAKRKLPLQKSVNFISKVVLKQYKIVVIVGLILFIISIPSLMLTKIDSSISAYLKKGSSTRKDLELIHQKLNGLASTEILICGDSLEFQTQNFMDSLKQVTNKLQNNKSVRAAISFNIGLKATISQKPFYEKSKIYQQIYHKKFRQYMNNHFDSTRITLFTGTMISEEQKQFFNEIKILVEDHFPNNHVQITGITKITHITTEKIVETQFKSLISASLVIMAIMWLLFGKRRGAMAMLVNLFPIAAIFAMMGYFGFPLNVATATIAAVAIGVVVDDTIHYNFSFNRYLIQGNTTSNAILKAHLEVGEAMILSSVIIIAGVLLFLFAKTGLMVQFGILTAVAISFALIADLFWGPALLMFLYKNDVKNPDKTLLNN